MPEITAFRALRYNPERFGKDLSKLIAPPYDVLTDDDKAALLARHERNIVAVDLPFVPPKSAGPDEVYEKAADTLDQWCGDGTMVVDEKPAIYVYHQQYEHAGRKYTRRKFFAHMRLEEFGKGTVFPHELTFGGPKADRLKLMEATRCQMSAVFGLYSDPNNAVSRLLDVGKRDWSDALLAATGLTRAQMPRLVEGSDVSGHLRAELAERWGIPRVPVAGGGGDNAATACGMGVMTPGTGFLSLGTSGVLFAATEAYAPNTGDAVHTFCHAVPDTWHQMGVILSATDSMSWLSEITGKPVPELAGLVGAVTAPSPVLFLPYLSGERTPLNDPDATGAFLGLRRATGLADLAQAAMEGVAMAFADCVHALRKAGTPIEAAYAVGGGARSRAWLRIMASATGLTLLEPEDGDFGAAFGAAKLAAACATGDTSDRIFARPAIRAEVVPDPELAAAYAKKYEAHHAAYPRLRDLTALGA